MKIRNWYKRSVTKIQERRESNPERETRRQQELLRMSQSRPIYTRPTKYSETMVDRI